MNAAVRINVRVQMGQAIAAFNSLIGRVGLMEKALNRADAASTGFALRAQNAFKQIELSGKRLIQTSRILIYNFTLPIVAAFGYLEKAALDVAEKQAILKQVYGDTSTASNMTAAAAAAQAHELSVLDKILVELSNGYGIAIQDVYDLAIAFGRAGDTGVQLAYDTENGLILMRAFGVEAENAAKAVLQLNESYRLTGRQTEVALGILAYASQQTRADLETLTRAFVKAAPAASQMGIDVAHLTAMLSAMQQAGFKGEEAGTALNFAMTRLLKPTPEAADLMRSFGIDVTKASWATADGTKRIDMLTEAFKGLNDLQRQYAINVLIGARQTPKLTAFFTDVLGPMGQYQKILKGTNDATADANYLQQQLFLAMDNDKTRLQILTNEMKNNFMVIAANLTPALLVLMRMLRDASEWFARLGDTAGGRTKQQLIVLGLVALAAVGPLALVVSSIEVLIGALGHLAFALVRVIPLLISPWGLVAAAFVTLVVLAIRFRDQFVAALEGMYYGVLAVAKAIYNALQWINPFARHSPSLVERTRDGVKAMIGYWKGLTPVLAVMDRAAAAVRAYGKATDAFTQSQQRAQRAEDRKNLRKVAGNEGVKAYNDLIKANRELEKQLPIVAKQYAEQAKVVDRAKVALDGANAELDAANAKLDDLRKQQQAAQKVVDKLGNPDGLRSQATAAASMARALSEAGNNSLAKRFQDQANALNAQADKAQAAQQQVDALSTQIDAQSDAVDALTAKRDALSATYDSEYDKLMLLKDGYDAIRQAIQDNTAALEDMAQKATAAVAAQAAAAKARASKSAGGAASDALAGFNAAGGPGGNVGKFGADALPKNLPGGGVGGSLDKFYKDLQHRMALNFQRLFGDPFTPVKKWWGKVESAFAWVRGQWDKIDLGGAKGGLAQRLHLDEIAGKARKAFGALRDAALNFWDAAGPTIIDGLHATLDALKVLGKILRETFEVVGKRVLAIWGELADWFQANGPAIGKVLGVLAKFVLDWYIMLLKVATLIVKVVWPLIRTGIDGIMQIIQGALQVVLGIIGFIFQVLTGHWKKAGEELLRVVRGLGNILVGAVKLLVGLIGAGLLALAVFIFGEIGVILGKVGELLVKGFKEFVPALVNLIKAVPQAIKEIAELIGEAITTWGPHALRAVGKFVKFLADNSWALFKEAWEAAWRFVDFLAEKLSGDWLTGGMAKFQGFVEDIASGAWNFFTQAIISYWDFVTFLGTRITTWTPKVLSKMGEFGKKIVGWVWDGLTAAWDGAWHLVGRIGTYLDTVRQSVITRLSTFGGNIPGWIWDGMVAVWDTSWHLVGRIGSYLASIRGDVADKLVSWGGKIAGWLWDGVEGSFSSAWKMVKTVREALNSDIVALSNKLSSFGKNIVLGVVDGIAGAATDLAESLWSVVKGGLSYVKNKAKVFSPSRLFASELGEPLAAGIGVGIGRQQQFVNASLSSLIDSAQQQAMRALSATLAMPTLTQDVRLNYLNAPLATLPGMQQAVGVPLPASATSRDALAAAAQANITNNFNFSEGEQADPHAVAAAVGFAINGTVTP